MKNHTAVKRTYVAPLCVTLAGHQATHMGAPVLMMAIDTYIQVSTSEETTDGLLKEILEILEEVVPSKNIPGLTVEVYYPDYFGSKAAIIVAATACYLDFTLGIVDSHNLQKIAYQVEKRIFKDSSHAQTTTCVQGGLVFYRKEFDFYKTVVKLPAKMPQSFCEHINQSQQPPQKQHAYELDRYIRRCVFSITHEELKMFKETWDITMSDIPSDVGSIQQAHKGCYLQH